MNVHGEGRQRHPLPDVDNETDSNASCVATGRQGGSVIRNVLAHPELSKIEEELCQLKQALAIPTSSANSSPVSPTTGDLAAPTHPLSRHGPIIITSAVFKLSQILY